MVMLKTPDAPATSKQLWLLHILTKTDTRNLNITMREASERIEALKSKPVDKSPLVNPHTTAISQDRQKIAQRKYDKTHKPLVEREVIQGVKPTGQTDMEKIKADFMVKAYPIGRAKAGNDKATIDFYEFNCKDCLFGQSSICEPKWESAGFMTCRNEVENVSFKCAHYEPVSHSMSEYCKRPHGKQCHRKSIENHCLECAYRTSGFMSSNNRTAWYSYVPTIAERIKTCEYWIKQFSDSPDTDTTEALTTQNNIIRMLNKLIGV